jgi:hypothetical protein
VKKPQKAKPVRAKVTATRTVALPKDDQRRVACLSRRNGEFARQLLFGCPDSHVLLKPLEFQVAVQLAFGVPLTSTRAISGHLVRCGDKKEHSFIVNRYGNCIMARTRCKGGHTRTPHHASQAVVRVSLGL